jgi:hypothetical protein
MIDFQLESLNTNLDNFCKDLSDTELAELTDFLSFGCYTEQPSDWVKDFIDDFIGTKEWGDNLSDEVKKPEFFNKASINTQEIVRIVRISLMVKSFTRFKKVVKKEPKVVLSKEDKSTLKEILRDHQAMLEYQLEDEDFIRNSVGDEDGEELVVLKRKQLDFLEKFGGVKFL